MALPQRHATLHDLAKTPSEEMSNRMNESREWVLKLSDFGSLNTIARSAQYEDEAIDDEDYDDEELDSLDDGLHDFREPSTYGINRRVDQSGGSILPAHDGLGTFAASSTPVQTHLWTFEQYNPQKKNLDHRRRRSSIQRRLDTLEDEETSGLENTRIERIEKWRIEQSKVLLEEIEKETRRRRLSRTSEERQKVPDNLSRDSTVNKKILVEDHLTPILEDQHVEESESFWQRFTRRVMHDLMGIDDSLLSIILGESLPLDDDLSSTPTPRDSFLSSPLLRSDPLHFDSTSRSWEDRLLDRLARELGNFVHRVSDKNSSPLNSDTSPALLDYAGIPITRHPNNHSASAKLQPLSTASQETPHFSPTLGRCPPAVSPASEHAAGWGIEDSHDPHILSTPDTDYWERTPDLKTVFGYLQNRFSSQYQSASPHPSGIAVATANTPDSLRRAAIIRQHHPLVSRSTRTPYDRMHARRNSFLPNYASPQLSPSLKRAGTSCASLSTKKSRRSEGSRHYWDLGAGSVGSGGTWGGTGTWGEV